MAGRVFSFGMNGVPRGIRTPVTAVKGRTGNSNTSVFNHLEASTRCNLHVCVTTALPDSSQVIGVTVQSHSQGPGQPGSSRTVEHDQHGQDRPAGLRLEALHIGWVRTCYHLR